MNLARITSLLLVSAALFASCNTPEITWREGEAADGKATHTIVVKNARRLSGNDWQIFCSQMPVGAKTIEGSDAHFEEFQANLHRITPLPSIGRRDSLVIRYQSSPLKRHSWAPEGFTLKKGNKVRELRTHYEFLPLEPDGDKWWDYNHSLCVSPVPFNSIVPAIKNTHCENPPVGWYRILVSDGQPVIEANDADGHYYGKITLERLRENLHGAELPDMEIEDWPDYAYRGFMLDVARNFTSKENLFKLIDLLARYKVNYLHLHLADDEGWRLAVDGLEELTSFGAVHSLDPKKGLQPSYDGNADPKSTALSNGFYTKEDYIEILKYAWDRRIRVIPEFDTPGHCRAAIKAMAARGEASLLLQDPSDDSKYYTAQGYTDNVMSVEMESVYTFVERIFDYLMSVYERAGVPLVAIHIGGDEVPRGAWQGKDLHQQYLRRVAELAVEKGVKIAGWQELAECSDEATAAVIQKVLFVTHVWNTMGKAGAELPYKLADKGYPVVLSNVDYTYADQAYSSNKEEIAHSWAHYVDDTRALTMPIRENKNICGIQGQLFTETIRSFDDVCYDIFPKMLGVFERAWNAENGRDCSQFYSTIVYNEMPYWELLGIRYHIPQPGLKVEDGKVSTYSLLPAAEVIVTKDGERVYARTRYGSQESVRTTAPL